MNAGCSLSPRPDAYCNPFGLGIFFVRVAPPAHRPEIRVGQAEQGTLCLDQFDKLRVAFLHQYEQPECQGRYEEQEPDGLALIR